MFDVYQALWKCDVWTTKSFFQLPDRSHNIWPSANFETFLLIRKTLISIVTEYLLPILLKILYYKYSLIKIPTKLEHSGDSNQWKWLLWLIFFSLSFFCLSLGFYLPPFCFSPYIFSRQNITEHSTNKKKAFSA